MPPFLRDSPPNDPDRGVAIHVPFKIYFRETARANGHRITSRMGPGYSYRHDSHVCTWPLEEQLSLFGLFGETALPVTVMESSAMLPKMSRSGLFGIARLTQ